MVGGIDPISSDAFPAVLARLLDARDPGAEDVAWREFVDAYSALVLQVAQSTATNRDVAMDTDAVSSDVADRGRDRGR